MLRFTVSVCFHTLGGSGVEQLASPYSVKVTAVCGAVALSAALTDPIFEVTLVGTRDGYSEEHAPYRHVPCSPSGPSQAEVANWDSSCTALPGGGGGGGGPGGGGAGGRLLVVPRTQWAFLPLLHDASVGLACTVPQNQMFAQSGVKTADCVAGTESPTSPWCRAAVPDACWKDMLLMTSPDSVPVPSP